MKIERIADGAYFVPSYSVATLAGYLAGVTTQGVSVADHFEDQVETSKDSQDAQDQPFGQLDFE